METLFLALSVTMLALPSINRFMKVLNNKKCDTCDLAGRFFEVVALAYILIHCVL